jgi:hypothetical protein
MRANGPPESSLVTERVDYPCGEGVGPYAPSFIDPPLWSFVFLRSLLSRTTIDARRGPNPLLLDAAVAVRAV